jgi:hypothetical protein
VAPTNGSAPPTNHEDPRDVTYFVVIAAALRELANREPQCMVALVLAGGTALSTMRRRLPRSLSRQARVPAGSLPVPDASL